MASSTISTYWREARAPRHSLIFAVPLVVLYELLAFSLSRGEASAVRNGADVLLRSLFLTFGGRGGLTIFGGILIGGGAAMVWRDYRRGGGINPWYFGWMALESIAYALAFGMVAGMLTLLLLPGMALVGPAPPLHAGLLEGFSLPIQLMISLGAGIYEELLFRVLLVGGLAWVAGKVLGLHRPAAGVLAAMAGALVFAAFHYVGPYGESLDLGSFTFRTVAGLLFSGLYLLRGFGITAWTHSLYDVFLALG
ncbi:MAG TPA: CPBP family glutamic-type intramembrane protease [Gemmatimonadales bacterium]|nr:CPBP family glutamic-type intramembrane protease [Gemmatimonadales bacterium]